MDSGETGLIGSLLGPHRNAREAATPSLLQPKQLTGMPVILTVTGPLARAADVCRRALAVASDPGRGCRTDRGISGL
jgi:hypothetical protein